MTTKIYKVAAIPGDGIGQEVITAGLEVLDALEVREGTFKFEISHFDWGTDRYLKTGEMMPSDGREQIRNMDAIYFGSAGDPRVADHISLWGLRLAICQPKYLSSLSVQANRGGDVVICGAIVLVVFGSSNRERKKRNI